ncbi:AAA family ATPase [Myxococcus sp. CA056]|uniref:AAA family ATPase n=1 Tax=Myxococcus sp. CA039A TaxID=2741737 RepID=UPI00157AB6DD|nr:ATP-binding protein [Myxococcus sp. CA039A]NTX10556.1 AAA family ATPase [Myxococcus sp. CA056]NTX58190.1 AAA family ATPase [Myxococcus sp. CA039A]
MIRSITLQNFKSFGTLQRVPLEPITVLVGPNNSGKSSFMTVGRFVSNLVVGQGQDAVMQEGDSHFLFHRPYIHAPKHGENLALGWETDLGSTYILELSRSSRVGAIPSFEEISASEADLTIRFRYPNDFIVRGVQTQNSTGDLAPALRFVVAGEDRRMLSFWQPLAHSRMVKLSLRALRADSEVVPEPKLTPEGAGLAAVLGLWRGSRPEKVEELESFLQKCLPEVRNALVRPAPTPGHQRLWLRQRDGEEFDAEHLSDGVLCFTALTMHAIEAGPGQIIFIEEPEHSIHPRRLRELVDLLKELTLAKKCQFVIATHSPVLLNAFRDEPEAIVLFRRSETGTRVNRLQDIPLLREALTSAPPGELLESGFFNQDF